MPAGPTLKTRHNLCVRDGRYHLAPEGVLTIATNSGCLVEITADKNGQVALVNICASRDREVKITLNGKIKG